MLVSKKKLAELERRVERTEENVEILTSAVLDHMSEHKESVEELKGIVASIECHIMETE